MIVKHCATISLFVGLISASNFMFLPIFDDPPKCGEHEMFKICLNNCSDCTHRGNCKFTDCKTAGCDCLPNFVHVTPGGPCEPVSMCPVPECDDNEVFRECGPLCESCMSRRCHVIHCEHRCYCKTGFLRDINNKCIPEEECPPRSRCSRHEEMMDSGPEYEYCIYDDIVRNRTMDKRTCYCKEGLKRNSMGFCVDESFCEMNICLGVERYSSCVPKCNTTCRNYNQDCEEDEECFAGCFCPKDYLMNDHRMCVRLEECPPGSNPFVPTAAPTTTIKTTEAQSTTEDILIYTTDSIKATTGMSSSILTTILSSTATEPTSTADETGNKAKAEADAEVEQDNFKEEEKDDETEEYDINTEEEKITTVSQSLKKADKSGKTKTVTKSAKESKSESSARSEKNSESENDSKIVSKTKSNSGAETESSVESKSNAKSESSAKSGSSAKSESSADSESSSAKEEDTSTEKMKHNDDDYDNLNL